MGYQADAAARGRVQDAVRTRLVLPRRVRSRARRVRDDRARSGLDEIHSRDCRLRRPRRGGVPPARRRERPGSRGGSRRRRGWHTRRGRRTHQRIRPRRCGGRLPAVPHARRAGSPRSDRSGGPTERRCRVVTLRFGVHTGLQHTSIDDLRSLWRRIEELGFDWISIWDHFYAADPAGDPPCLGAITAHTALAATTERVPCGSLVYSAGYRHPAVLANAMAPLHPLAHGRAVLLLGGGWLKLQ